MTKKLYEMFKEKYPQEWNRFSIYGADERIIISVIDKSIYGKSRDLINLP